MKICQPVTWIANPFQSDRSTRILSVADEELIDVSEDTVLNMNFNRNKLMQFWLNHLQTYPNISAASSEVLLPFTSHSHPFLCETSFSLMVAIKTQFRNRLQLSGSLRLKVTAKEVDIDTILKGGQSFACGTL
ncbi:Zinc finger BED domain-containing protein 5 [Trichinella zimbabwensis]|uniref:Zinc finger BED domain-containing protein 5 n=1 Tax=Trichinella zimbabwensis TaxID=268475 RepID=A0A0V1HLP5_9BILA|nr:Zinc finger BED domain-containing protein 5 [Trichinella zimbabwensis]